MQPKLLKYIVTDKKAVAIFSETCVHADMARGMWGKPVSAGFCTIIYAGDLHGMSVKSVCHGRSASLDLDSRKELDEEIINKYLGQ